MVAASCLGLAAANVVRVPPAAAAVAALGLVAVAALVDVADATGTAGGQTRTVAVALALLVLGLGWGGGRLAALDASVLRTAVGRSAAALVETTAPARIGPFAVRVTARVVRFGRLRPAELVLLQLPPGRAPPQGTRLAVHTTIELPRGPADGFDERAWLRRQGIQVVLKGGRWRPVGRRGGIFGVADRLHHALGRAAAPGLEGERRAVLEGVVLGEDQGLSDELRASFRASGLYHLLAVSGQNVVFVGGGALALAWLLGFGRLAGEAAALASIVGYVLAVGLQPSVVRAGIAGVLGSLAWLAARQRDRWYALLLGALVLLAWNPYLVRDPGFQLSFAAVAAIFTLAPAIVRALDGWPLPKRLAETIAISTACGVATAPIVWLQFHAVPLLAIPANLLVALIVPPLLWLAFATVALAALAPAVAVAVAAVNGWCAAYLAACARAVAAVPGAQLTSGRGAAAAAGGALLVGAYACRRGQRAEAGLPPRRQRPAEDHARRAAAARTSR